VRREDQEWRGRGSDEAEGSERGQGWGERVEGSAKGRGKGRERGCGERERTNTR